MSWQRLNQPQGWIGVISPSPSSEGFQEKPGAATVPDTPPEFEPHLHQPVWLDRCPPLLESL